MMKKVGILGSGNVGKTLADGFIKHGYDVKIGSGSPEKLSEWRSGAGDKGSVGSFKEAAAFGEVLVLAVKGTVVEKILNEVRSEIDGKTIIDATNPIADEAPEEGLVKFTTDLSNSLMEKLQATFPKANFVKAFNSVGAHLMVNPQFEVTPTMFIAGNNEESKNVVSKILDQFGYEAEDLGGAKSARAIEPLCILWCIPGFRNNEWGHAFKLLKK
ncbi:MAG: NAD(P)-binding domain-containing protein [Cyclobacteriaceae bacterium]|nr:NAD(P)-binding domain-containing protein [Cyclobacteriaceae bacterium SS2]